MDSFSLPWPPTSGNHQYGKHARGVYLRPEVKAWRDEVAWLSRGHKAEAPVELHIRLYPPDNRRRDADNVLKLLLDALVQAEVIPDDSNRVVRAYRLEWGQARPGGAIEVEVHGRNRHDQTGSADGGSVLAGGGHTSPTPQRGARIHRKKRL